MHIAGNGPRARAVIEVLEQRRLLASVTGTIFNDLNANGAADAGEPGLAGVTVFADDNASGVLDAGEASTTTDAAGHYALDGLSPGEHHIAQLAPANFQPTAPGTGRLYGAITNGSSIITRFDPRTGATLSSFDSPVVLGTGSGGFALGPASLFLIVSGSSTSTSQTIREVDANNGTLIATHTVPVGPTSDIAYLGGQLYIQQAGSGNITVFDPATDTISRTITVAAPVSGGLAAAPDLGLLFAAENSTSGKIYAVNPQNGAIVRTLTPAANRWSSLAYGGAGELLATPSGSNTIQRIDPLTGSILGTLSPTLAGGSLIRSLAGDGRSDHVVNVSEAGTSSGIDFGDIALSATPSRPALKRVTGVAGVYEFFVDNTTPGSVVKLYNSMLSPRDNPIGTAIAGPDGATVPVTISPITFVNGGPIYAVQQEPGKLQSSRSAIIRVATGIAAPAIAQSSDSGVSNTDGITRVKRPTLSGTASNSLVTIYANGRPIGDGLPTGGNAYAFTPTTDFADGMYYLTTVQTPSFDTPVISLQDRIIVIDTAAPVVQSASFAFDAAAPAARWQFSEAVTPTAAAQAVVTDLATGLAIPPDHVSLSFSGSTAQLTFPGYPGGALPDGNYRVTLNSGSVTDLAGNGYAAPATFNFFVLAADANRDRAVDTTDFNVLAANFGQSGRSFSQGNFDYSADGVVNTTDFNLLASRFGTTIAPAAGASRALAAPLSQWAASPSSASILDPRPGSVSDRGGELDPGSI